MVWSAVRRRLNMAVDAEATEGIYWARRLRDEGCVDPRTSTRWLGGPDEARDG